MNKSNLFIFGIIAVLALTIFAGCDQDKNIFEDNSPWKMDDGSSLVFKNRTWEWMGNNSYNNTKIYDFKGTYVYSGNKATMMATHFGTAVKFEEDWFDWIPFPPAWTATVTNNRIKIDYNLPETEPEESVGFIRGQ